MADRWKGIVNVNRGRKTEYCAFVYPVACGPFFYQRPEVISPIMIILGAVVARMIGGSGSPVKDKRPLSMDRLAVGSL